MPIRHLNWLVGVLAGLALTATAAAQVPGEQGRVLFEQLCVACHTVGGGDRVGPDLAGVTLRRDEAWLKRMISEPDAMIAEGDPVVAALVERYNRIVMPRLGLDGAKVEAIVTHLRALDAGTAAPTRPAVVYDTPELMQPQARIWQVFLLISAVIALVFTAVAFSTRSPREVSVARAYSLRRLLFLAALVAVIGMLATTFPQTPYAADRNATTAGVDRIIYVAARQFDFIWSDEPIASLADIGRVPRLAEVVIDAGATVPAELAHLQAAEAVYAQARAPRHYVLGRSCRRDRVRQADKWYNRLIQIVLIQT